MEHLSDTAVSATPLEDEHLLKIWKLLQYKQGPDTDTFLIDLVQVLPGAQPYISILMH